MDTAIEKSRSEVAPAAGAKTPPFGVNEMRLSPREWIITLAIVVTCFIAIPRLWKKFEPFKTGDDYRIPYALSKDYWLFQRRLERDAIGDKIPILGDSVVWGEYVRPDGTLSHFLNQQSGANGRFLNCGVNGMFPLALEGLISDYGQTLSHRRVIVQYNVLWMTSPKADLSQPKEEDFNHAQLVPQFFPRIPCYRADANARLSAVITRHVAFYQWAGHLEDAYYDQRGIPKWTLEDDGHEPPGYPNAWRNPLAPLKNGIPIERSVDPLRGPASPRHKPWNADGSEPTDFEWVDLDASLQWQAFNRVIELLRRRGNDVLIIVGPFNEHFIAEDQHPMYRKLCQTITARLTKSGFPVVAPATLPSALYADASHPLTQGYEKLAREIASDAAFQRWFSGKAAK